MLDAPERRGADTDVLGESGLGKTPLFPPIPDGQDALIAAVAAANPNTIVVLETGGAVTMPWIDSVKGVVEAWYPGTKGGTAIARVLSGAVNPSGHLPITFPVRADQFPRADISGKDVPPRQPFDLRLSEGAMVGYKWFDAKRLSPLFPFGHGLSYTNFRLTGLSARANGRSITANFRIQNTGRRTGAQVAQIYVAPESNAWEGPKRLGGFVKLSLKPGGSKSGSVTIDPRLLATWDDGRHTWHITAGHSATGAGTSTRCS